MYDKLIGKIVMISFGELRKVPKKNPESGKYIDVIEYPYIKGELINYRGNEAILKDMSGKFNIITNVKKIRELDDLK
ncbi:MAG: hypothetical protein ACFFG0_40295 [Candidatus Thorarchaeota archaeon]